MSISSTLKRIYSYNPYDVDVFDTIEINYPTSQKHRFVDADEDMVLGSKNYYSNEFEVTLPEQFSKEQVLSLVFQNVDNEFGILMRSYTVDGSSKLANASLTYRLFTSLDTSTPELEITLKITSVQIDMKSVSLGAVFEIPYNEQFPRNKFTKEQFPQMGAI